MLNHERHEKGMDAAKAHCRTESTDGLKASALYMWTHRVTHYTDSGVPIRVFPRKIMAVAFAATVDVLVERLGQQQVDLFLEALEESENA